MCQYYLNSKKKKAARFQALEELHMKYFSGGGYYKTKGDFYPAPAPSVAKNFILRISKSVNFQDVEIWSHEKMKKE